MAHVRFWAHAVWGTKNRHPYLTGEIRTAVIDHIKSNAENKNIYVYRINGHLEHLHCLLALNADMSITKTMQLIKGESSLWINKHKITNLKFEWAEEYFSVSVSESLLGKVAEYIDNQEEHHKRVTFSEECALFMSRYKFQSQG